MKLTPISLSLAMVKLESSGGTCEALGSSVIEDMEIWLF